MIAGDLKQRELFELVRDTVINMPDEFIVYEGTIDSIFEIDDCIYRARMKVEPPEGGVYRVHLLCKHAYKTGYSNEWASVFADTPLRRTECEIGDKVEVIGWKQDLKFWTKFYDEDIFRLNIPVRGFANYTAQCFATSYEMRKYLNIENE